MKDLCLLFAGKVLLCIEAGNKTPMLGIEVPSTKLCIKSNDAYEEDD